MVHNSSAARANGAAPTQAAPAFAQAPPAVQPLTTACVHAEPILIVPAWIMKYCILDLTCGTPAAGYAVLRAAPGTYVSAS